MIKESGGVSTEEDERENDRRRVQGSFLLI